MSSLCLVLVYYLFYKFLGSLLLLLLVGISLSVCLLSLSRFFVYSLSLCGLSLCIFCFGLVLFCLCKFLCWFVYFIRILFYLCEKLSSNNLLYLLQINKLIQNQVIVSFLLLFVLVLSLLSFLISIVPKSVLLWNMFVSLCF